VAIAVATPPSAVKALMARVAVVWEKPSTRGRWDWSTGLVSVGV